MTDARALLLAYDPRVREVLRRREVRRRWGVASLIAVVFSPFLLFAILFVAQPGPSEYWGPMPSIWITSGECPLGVVGEDLTHVVPVAGNSCGGPWPMEILAGGLPPGLSLDPNRRAIVGTPHSAGFYAFRLRVTDACPVSAEADFAWLVVNLPGAAR